VTPAPAGGSPPSRGLIVLALVAALGTLGLGVAVVLTRDGQAQNSETGRIDRGPFRGNTLPAELRGRPAPDFDLRDAGRRRLAATDLRGRPYVLTFLYTDCPDVCPLIGQELRRAIELLGGKARRVAAVAVSVDPEGDTEEAVGLWKRRLRMPHNFHYLIGSADELRPVWNSYFAAPQAPGAEDSLHTASIWLIDARGRWRTKFSGGVPVPPADIAHDLRVLVDEAA
jgi:protein SCO1